MSRRLTLKAVKRAANTTNCKIVRLGKGSIWRIMDRTTGIEIARYNSHFRVMWPNRFTSVRLSAKLSGFLRDLAYWGRHLA